MKNPRYVVWLWDKFGSKLKPAAKKIRAMKFSPAVSEKLETLSNAMPSSIRNILLKLVTKAYKDVAKKHGKDKMTDLLTQIAEFIKTMLQGLAK